MASPKMNWAHKGLKPSPKVLKEGTKESMHGCDTSKLAVDDRHQKSNLASELAKIKGDEVVGK